MENPRLTYAAGLRARPALFALMIDTAAFRARFPRIDAYVTEEYKPMAEVAAERVLDAVHQNAPVGPRRAA